MTVQQSKLVPVDKAVLTEKHTADVLDISLRTFRRKRAFYVAHGLQIVTDPQGRRFAVRDSLDRMIRNWIRKEGV